LLSAREELGIEISAAHFDHGLRGEASREDAAFCAALCAKEGVKLYTQSGNMLQKEKPKGQSEETWARNLRYDFFEQIANECGSRWVATAHTQSDNAETVLFNAIRGSAAKGLAGIPPIRGIFCRPLLEVSGAVLRELCAEEGWVFREDATNAERKYSRNKLRLDALPLLEEIHPGAGAALARMAENMREIDEYLAAEAAGYIDSSKAKRISNATVLAKAPPPVRKKALAMLVGERGLDRKTMERMEDVVFLKAKATELPGGRKLRRTGGIVYLDSDR
jgi:tRNA(Ile)-lysidine synthase